MGAGLRDMGAGLRDMGAGLRDTGAGLRHLYHQRGRWTQTQDL